MTFFTRSLLLLGTVALCGGLFGCPPPEKPKPPESTDGGACTEDSDCPDPAFFECSSVSYTCVPSCRTKADCTAAVRGEWAIPECEGGLGCECDEQQCVTKLCSADSDCGGKVCRNGACVDAPTAAEVATCAVTPAMVVGATGGKGTFAVSAYNAGGQPVVLGTSINWTAENAAVSVAGAATGVSVDFNFVSATVSPVVAVKATVGAATCTASVLILSNTSVPAGKIRVVVSDELSGYPIANAAILVSDAQTGSLVNSPVQCPGQAGAACTDANGVVEVSFTGSSVSVTAMHKDYSYLTFAGYDTTTGSRALHLVLRRNQTDRYGGYKGGVNNVPLTGNVHAGIAGFSLPGSITDLDVTQLLGPTTPTNIHIADVITKDNVPMPAGTFLGFGDIKIKDDVAALGLAGTCTRTLGGVDPVTAAKEGKCGTRTAWALLGDVPLSELPIDAFSNGLTNVDFGKVLPQIIPLFKRFSSSIGRDVQFALIDTPGAQTGDPDFSNKAHFETFTHTFDQLPLGFNFAVRVPQLPKFRGASYVDSAVVLGGSIVPGRGVVPLGMGAGVNSTPATDGLVDKNDRLPAAGLVPVRMAPAHHGIEGTQYGLVALAASIKAITDASAGLGMSSILHRIPTNRLVFDPDGTAPVDIPGTFLAIPEHGRYNFLSNPQAGFAKGRQFVLSPDPGVAGASLLRVSFSDNAGHSWIVYVDPATAVASGFVLPAVPVGVGLADRTFHTGDLNGSRSMLNLQLIKLADAAGTAVTAKQLVELNATNGDRMIDWTQAFSVLDYGRPTVKFLEPVADGSAVKQGAAVKVKVTHFKIGTNPANADEGWVQLAFADASGNAIGTCPSTATAAGSTDASGGQGEISVQLPATCAGNGVKITARLMDLTDAPIKPEAAATLTVNIAP